MIPLIEALGVLHGVLEPSENGMLEYASRLIDQLNGTGETIDALIEPEAPFEVDEIRNEPGGYDFER